MFVFLCYVLKVSYKGTSLLILEIEQINSLTFIRLPEVEFCLAGNLFNPRLIYGILFCVPFEYFTRYLFNMKHKNHVNITDKSDIPKPKCLNNY